MRERQGRKPKARGPNLCGAAAAAAALARFAPPAQAGEDGPPAAGTAPAACTARPAPSGARRGYVTRLPRGWGGLGLGRGGHSPCLAQPLSLSCHSFLPLQALVIVAVTPPPPPCVHPWKYFRVRGLAPSHGTTGGCGPFQRKSRLGTQVCRWPLSHQRPSVRMCLKNHGVPSSVDVAVTACTYGALADTHPSALPPLPVFTHPAISDRYAHLCLARKTTNSIV